MPLDLSAASAPYSDEDVFLVSPEDRLSRAAESHGLKKAPRRGLHPALLAGPPLAAMADAYSTNRLFDQANDRYAEDLAFAQANPGEHTLHRPVEYNGMLRDIAGTAKLYPVKGAIGLGLSGAAELAARSGHRNLGKLIAIGGTVLPLALAGHNMMQARKVGRVP